MKIYFAGKVAKNGWRQEIINLRGAVDLCHQPLMTHVQEGILIEEDLYYNGPYVFGCDHGCYHGKNNHGVGANEMSYDCGGANPLTKPQVFELCTTLISQSDAVFCYFDDLSAYGTLYELGFAHALAIPVYFYHSKNLSADELSDLWFILQGADVVSPASSAKDAFEQFKVAIKPSLEPQPIFPEEREDTREPLTVKQQKYLLRLLKEANLRLNVLASGTCEPVKEVEEAEVSHLSKKEAQVSIGVLLMLLNHSEDLKKATTFESMKIRLAQLDAEHLSILRSVKLERSLIEVQARLSRLKDYDIPTLWTQLREVVDDQGVDLKHAMKRASFEHAPVKQRGPIQDARVKSRNRAKESFHPFNYLPQKKNFAKKLGDYVSHAVVRDFGILRPPHLLNHWDRELLAQEFLQSPFFKEELLPDEVDEEVLLAEIAKFIDENIPRAYAKYALGLEKSPSAYEVDAAGFGLTYQLR